MAMTETDIRQLCPKMPNPEEIDPNRVVFSFDRPSDTLMVHLYGRARPAVSDPVGDHLSLRVDAETEDVVGFQIEEFLLCVVRDHPAFLEIAEFASVPAAEIAAIRRSLAHDTRQRAAVETVFAHLAAMTSAAAGHEAESAPMARSSAT